MMWSNGFKGKIIKEDQKYVTYGIASKNDKKIKITELPLRKWTEDYKKFLIDSEYKFNEYHTEKSVHFEIRDGEEIEEEDLIPIFKLPGEDLSWCEKLNVIRRDPAHPEKPPPSEKEAEYFEKITTQILTKLA